ncbi:MAG: hypothetical protein H8D45_04940 [Bacteroidetes bacterium]|nr:hypothetical protein [Bacteroidota bacterium]
MIRLEFDFSYIDLSIPLIIVSKNDDGTYRIEKDFGKGSVFINGCKNLQENQLVKKLKELLGAKIDYKELVKLIIEQTIERREQELTKYKERFKKLLNQRKQTILEVDNYIHLFFENKDAPFSPPEYSENFGIALEDNGVMEKDSFSLSKNI